MCLAFQQQYLTASFGLQRSVVPLTAFLSGFDCFEEWTHQAWSRNVIAGIPEEQKNEMPPSVYLKSKSFKIVIYTTKS